MNVSKYVRPVLLNSYPIGEESIYYYLLNPLKSTLHMESRYCQYHYFYSTHCASNIEHTLPIRLITSN